MVCHSELENRHSNANEMKASSMGSFEVLIGISRPEARMRSWMRGVMLKGNGGRGRAFQKDESMPYATLAAEKALIQPHSIAERV